MTFCLAYLCLFLKPQLLKKKGGKKKKPTSASMSLNLTALECCRLPPTTTDLNVYYDLDVY